ncbi:methyltransferase domain-containing protein, partial [Maritalea sp.]|uniref:methyltransferase domain-containing protein n=1 Tax=Maritalea sp. TaxID=2003361 RepID=UPI003EF8DD22
DNWKLSVVIDRFKSDSGKPYSKDEWLDNHHSIKSRLRTELVQKLDLREGDRVLDIGCGTGNWTSMLADQIGHTGTVLAIDVDAHAVGAADAKRLLHHHRSRMSFERRSILELDHVCEFDAVTAFNSLCYVEQPEAALEKIRYALKPGGRLIVKDSDLGSDFFWPVDRETYFSLMIAIQEHGSNANENFYDPFFARQLPRLLAAGGYEQVSALAQSFSFVHPVDKFQRLYVAENGRMIADRAQAAGMHQLAEKWRALFDDQSEDCIFNSPNFLYTMTEFVFQARAPSNS